jgi:CRP-like cAMP-binding protein
MFQSRNALLARIDGQAAEQIRPHMKSVPLRHGEVIAEAGRPVDRVYFPDSGVVSCMVVLDDGVAIETAMIGRDGQFGAGQVLDDLPCLNTVTIQAPGTALGIEAQPLRDAAEAVPSLRKLLMGYEHFIFSQAQQSVACNATHDIQARTCRWLLRMYDLAGSDLPITQQLVAQMMGVRRTSVAVTLSQMQKEGLVAVRRDSLQIINIDRVAAQACECHGAVARQYRTLFGSRAGATMAHLHRTAASRSSAAPPGDERPA